MSWLFESSLKAALLLAMSWLGAVLLRRGTAATRHQIWALGTGGALLLPLLCWALPPLSLPLRTPTSGAGRVLLATAALVTGGRASSASPSWPSWLAIIWAAGMLLVSLWFLRGYLRARRLSRAAGPADSKAWLSARLEAAAALGITRHVDLGRSEAIGSPMTVGVLRPRVLLPAAADGWSPQLLRVVLMHELGHVTRHDTFIQLIAQVGCALYWWNPLAWLAAARLRIEREHACDDMVLGAGIRPSSYAADLLDVARSIPRSQTGRVGALSMVDPSSMEARLRRILDGAAPRRPLGAQFRMAARGATLALVATLACAAVPRDPSALATASVAGSPSEDGALMAGGIHARITGPGADARTYTVRMHSCSPADTLEPWAYAEGVVDGKRRSVLLRVMPTSDHCVYQLTREWPQEGRWMIRLSLGHPPAPATVSALRADGSVESNKLYFKSDGSRECHKALKPYTTVEPDC